jgi:hypothetical protein
MVRSQNAKAAARLFSRILKACDIMASVNYRQTRGMFRRFLRELGLLHACDALEVSAIGRDPGYVSYEREVYVVHLRNAVDGSEELLRIEAYQDYQGCDCCYQDLSLTLRGREVTYCDELLEESDVYNAPPSEPWWL